jgi:sulfopyruvate decarboxylase TPP-binding subunit
MVAQEMELTGRRIIDELKKCGFTHLIWLLGSELRFMYEAMMNQKEITLVPFCREGEAVAIAAGLVLGGKKPVVLYQNAGLYEAGDSIRLVSFELHLPLLMLIGYRGWKGTDSAGTIFEPTLDAWGIKYYLVHSDEDVEKISIGDKQAQETDKPVAILIVREEHKS